MLTTKKKLDIKAFDKLKIIISFKMGSTARIIAYNKARHDTGNMRNALYIEYDKNGYQLIDSVVYTPTHEFGDAERGITAQPFMRPGVIEAAERLTEYI